MNRSKSLFSSLAFYMTIQLLLSSVFVLTTIWYRDDSFSYNEYKRLPAVEIFVFLSLQNWFWPTLCILLLFFLFGLYFLIRWRTSSYTLTLPVNTIDYWIIFTIYVSFIFFWNVFFCTLASDSICDPILRFQDNDKFIVYPLSEIDNSDVTFLIPREKTPKINGICVADTQFSIRGQQQITVAIIGCVLGFIACIITKFFYFENLTIAGAFLENMFIIITFTLSLQIIFNDEVWDWRVFVSIFFALIVSEFSMVSVLFREDAYRKTSWIFCMIWIYAQVLDSVENAFFSIFASKSDISVYF